LKTKKITTAVSNDDIASVIEQTNRWSRKQLYKGHNKHDGLNSPILKLFLGWSKWPRIFAIQGIMRLPINIRPLFLVKKSYNPKGLALFVQGYLYRYQTTQQEKYLHEAEKLLQILIDIRASDRWKGLSWGYHYPWQDPGFYAPSNTPNAVVTSFVCEAMLHAYRVTKKDSYLDQVNQSIVFFTQHLQHLKESDSELCLSYMPIKMSMRVMDVSILIAAVMAQYCQLAADNTHMEKAHRLATYVARQQTEYGAWYYTDPKEDSLITHDNYHTGFILDAFDRYRNACAKNNLADCSHVNYDLGLKYYADNLFNNDGTPRWMHDQDYPHDIHGAAQGIITFSRHLQDHQSLVTKILEWSIGTMWNRQGRFYYQQTPVYRKRFTLLRWCNAWMMKALSEYLFRCEKH